MGANSADKTTSEIDESKEEKNAIVKERADSDEEFSEISKESEFIVKKLKNDMSEHTEKTIEDKPKEFLETETNQTGELLTDKDVRSMKTTAKQTDAYSPKVDSSNEFKEIE